MDINIIDKRAIPALLQFGVLGHLGHFLVGPVPQFTTEQFARGAESCQYENDAAQAGLTSSE